MKSADDSFYDTMVNIRFRKNQPFKSDPLNLCRIIHFIQIMEINEKAFEIIEYLIKEWGVSILICFEPFYQRLKMSNLRSQFEEKMQRISALVVFTVKPSKFGELRFFTIAGTAQKGFNVKQKTSEEIQFLQQLSFIRNCISRKKSEYNLSKEHIDQLNELKQKIVEKKFNFFASHYLNTMMQRVEKQYCLENIESLFIKQTTDLRNQRGKRTQNIKEKQLKALEQGKICFSDSKIILEKQIKAPKIYQQIDFNEKYQRITSSKGQIKQTQGYLQQAIFSYELSNLEQDNFNNSKFLNSKAVIEKQNKQKKSKIKPLLNKLAQSSLSSLDLNDSTSSQKNDFSMLNKFHKNGLNFSLIPLCCRTYFFDQERILLGEDKVTEYKSYRFPFNSASIETFKKTVCAFLNTCGGQIYLGIKQTTNKKYRYVLSNYLNENDKEEVLKSFRKISEQIRPHITDLIQIQFVPVRKSPFSNLNLASQVETYFYDFSKKELNLDQCPYRPGRYVIRVRVPMGAKKQLYSYIQTQYQLNKNSASNQFIPFRSQNEVLIKQISQEVLIKFKKKLIQQQQKQQYPRHPGNCPKPDIGNPRNQAEPRQEMNDAKQIETSLYSLENKKSNFLEKEGYLKQIISIKEEQSKIKKKPDYMVSQAQLRRILQYPLDFICLRITEQKLKKCIYKTPAKDYTLISLQKNQIRGENILLIKIDSYSNMQQFLRIKAQIESYYEQDHTRLIGISKRIKLQSMENRKKFHHKHAINNKILELYSITSAASYFLQMQDWGYRVEAIPD